MRFKKLKSLNLSYNGALSDIKVFNKDILTKLESLNLGANTIKDKFTVENLKKKIPDFEIFWLYPVTLE